MGEPADSDEVNALALFGRRNRGGRGSRRPVLGRGTNSTQQQQQQRPQAAGRALLSIADDLDDALDDDEPLPAAASVRVAAAVRVAPPPAAPPLASSACSYDAEELARLKRETYKAPPPPAAPTAESPQAHECESEHENEQEAAQALEHATPSAAAPAVAAEHHSQTALGGARRAAAAAAQERGCCVRECQGALRRHQQELERAQEALHAAEAEREAAALAADAARALGGEVCRLMGAVARHARAVDAAEDAVLGAMARAADRRILARRGVVVVGVQEQQEPGGDVAVEIDGHLARLRGLPAEVRDAEALLRVFCEWRCRSSALYSQAAAPLALPAVLAPCAKAELLARWHTLVPSTKANTSTDANEHEQWWCPLRTTAWHQACVAFGERCGAEQTLAEAVCERVAVPRVKHLVDRCWDPLVLAQHRPVLRVVEDALHCVAHTSTAREVLAGAVCGALEGALARLTTREPLLLAGLLVCCAAWRVVIGDAAAQHIAVGALLTDRLLPLLRSCDSAAVGAGGVGGGVLGAVVRALPSDWTAQTVPQLGALAELIRQRADKDELGALLQRLEA